MPQVKLANIHQKVMKAGTMKGTPVARSFQGLAYGSLKGKFDANRRMMLGDFRNHEVTLELDAGPLAESKFLPVGNLFSLIGFNAGDDPTAPIEQILSNPDNVKLFPNPSNIAFSQNRINYRFKYQVPTESDIYKVTEYPDNWNPGSWVRGLEKGLISNIMHYLFNRKKIFDKSRSGPAVQMSKNIGSISSLSRISYVSDILKEFVNKMKK